MQRFGCSQRNALRVVKMSASTYLYKSVRKDESALKMRIKEITETRVHYGYRRVHVLLRREGHAVLGQIANWRLSHQIFETLGKARTRHRRLPGQALHGPAAARRAMDGRNRPGHLRISQAAHPALARLDLV